MKVKKLVQERKLKLTIWNLGTLSKKKKKMELVDTMMRRRINIIHV